MTDSPTPIRTITPAEMAIMINVNCGDPFPLAGHAGHHVSYKLLDFEQRTDVWCRIDCSCGETYGGAVERSKVVSEPGYR